jgi:hypothetical protein
MTNNSKLFIGIQQITRERERERERERRERRARERRMDKE